MKLHKAIKRLKEGFRISTEIMQDDDGYIFFEDGQIWFSTPRLGCQLSYTFGIDDFKHDWKIVRGI